MDTRFDEHPIEPDDPWPKSPTTVPIRCGVCLDVRYFEDRHAVHADASGPGPLCKVCGRRIELRCTVCDERWRPLP